MREVNTHSCREVFTVVWEGDVGDGISGEVEGFRLQVIEWDRIDQSHLAIRETNSCTQHLLTGESSTGTSHHWRTEANTREFLNKTYNNEPEWSKPVLI